MKNKIDNLGEQDSVFNQLMADDDMILPIQQRDGGSGICNF